MKPGKALCKLENPCTWLGEVILIAHSVYLLWFYPGKGVFPENCASVGIPEKTDGKGGEFNFFF